MRNVRLEVYVIFALMVSTVFSSQMILATNATVVAGSFIETCESTDPYDFKAVFLPDEDVYLIGDVRDPPGPPYVQRYVYIFTDRTWSEGDDLSTGYEVRTQVTLIYNGLFYDIYPQRIWAASESTPGYYDVILDHDGDEQYSDDDLIDWYIPSEDVNDASFYVSGAPTAPTIESCDSTGAEKGTFEVWEEVYVMGSGYSASTTYGIYVVEDVATWTDGMSIPTRVSGTATSVSSDADENIPATLVWGSPLPGKYDIVVDVDGDGTYDEGTDALDHSDIEVTASFFVVPEVPFGSAMALLAALASLLWKGKRKLL